MLRQVSPLSLPSGTSCFTSCFTTSCGLALAKSLERCFRTAGALSARAYGEAPCHQGSDAADSEQTGLAGDAASTRESPAGAADHAKLASCIAVLSRRKWKQRAANLCPSTTPAQPQPSGTCPDSHFILTCLAAEALLQNRLVNMHGATLP